VVAAVARDHLSDKLSELLSGAQPKAAA